MTNATIRTERPEDYHTVEALTKRAFWNVNSPGADEHYMLHCMRDHEDFVPELDLVTEADGEIIAHVAYVKARLLDEEGNRKEILSFGPISVDPAHQRQGYGKQLLQYSFAAAAQMGYDAVVIFGNPENYICNGFRSCKKYNVSYGDNKTFPVSLLVKELKEGALAGKCWSFLESEACIYDASGVEAFDKDFPAMEKAYRKSQELFYIYSRSNVTRD